MAVAGLTGGDSSTFGEMHTASPRSAFLTVLFEASLSPSIRRLIASRQSPVSSKQASIVYRHLVESLLEKEGGTFAFGPAAAYVSATCIEAASASRIALQVGASMLL